MVESCDLSSLNSVRQCAKKLNESEEKIDILVNNAGVYAATRDTNMFSQSYISVKLDICYSDTVENLGIGCLLCHFMTRKVNREFRNVSLLSNRLVLCHCNWCHSNCFGLFLRFPLVKILCENTWKHI